MASVVSESSMAWVVAAPWSVTVVKLDSASSESEHAAAPNESANSAANALLALGEWFMAVMAYGQESVVPAVTGL